MSEKYLGLIPYTGNKTELLPKLFELFPREGTYSRFVDAFCGGLSVALNAPCASVLANDIDWTLINMYRRLRPADALERAKELIAEHGLNATDKEAYVKFRDYHNNEGDDLSLYVLLMHSFSNMNRRNSNHEFNVHFGNRTINSSTVARFEHYQKNYHKIRFSSAKFHTLDIHNSDFLYCDPPYLITEAAYNKYWSADHDKFLFAWLDFLNSRGVKWGLSNVTHHAGQQNDVLIEWMQKYNVHNLNKRYLFGQHVDGFDGKSTQEVYVCNYENIPTLDDIG